MTSKTFKVSATPSGVAIAAGIDVHKYKLQVCIMSRLNGHMSTLGEQLFANDEQGRKEMCSYIANYYPAEIAMEKTGVLSDPVHDFITRFRGWKRNPPATLVVPPDVIKRFPGEPHTDKHSARALAVLALSGLLKSIYTPTTAGKQLRQLTREAEGLTKDSTAIINEMKDMLGGIGFTLPDFSLTSAWGLDFLRLLIMDGIDGDITKLYKLVEQGHVKVHSESKKAILKRKTQYMRYTNLNISRFDAWRLNRFLTKLCMIEALKQDNTNQIEAHVNENALLKENIKRIAEVHGIGTPGATIITAEVDDPSRFKTARKFQLYVGRAVAPDSSGEHVGRPHMTKRCNHHLKRVFKQAGLTASRPSSVDCDITRYAKRQLAKHRSLPSIGKANTSAKIAKIVYKIMHDGVLYDPVHEIRRKVGILDSEVSCDPKPWKAQFVDARKRAARFRNFTQRVVNDLPDGDLKVQFAQILDIFKNGRE